MKKMNNQGFTLIELLTVFVILAILMTVGTIAVSRYLKKAKTQSYDTMEKSAYSAAQNYVMNDNIMLNDGQTVQVSIATLVDEGYLEPLIDPGKNNGSKCAGTVVITKKTTSAEQLDDLTYEIRLQCSAYKCSSNCAKYPKG